MKIFFNKLIYNFIISVDVVSIIKVLLKINKNKNKPISIRIEKKIKTYTLGFIIHTHTMSNLILILEVKML